MNYHKMTKKELIDELLRLEPQVSASKQSQPKSPPDEKRANQGRETFYELEEKYNAITEIVLDGIFIIDFEGKVLYCNKSAVKMFGFERPEQGLGKNIFEFVTSDSLKTAQEDLVKVYQGRWGFLAPYKVRDKNGREFWVETLGRKTTYQNKPAELVVVRDITARKLMEEALHKAKNELEQKVEERTSELQVSNERLIQEIKVRQNAEVELQDSLEKLQRLLKETVSALASAVEAKDPYTAGHQQRVSNLACAIAKEMGLSQERLDGIHMAAIVHDIGKIHVPAEILANPGRLSDIEFNMIKTHAQFGYDILKAIEFPWPVALAVLQHHERVNGSGYPSGLKGDEIIVEAKILAVADVAEAISTNRPYRLSRGIDKALEEISTNKGILYDAAVVDACLKLFYSKEFTFE